MQKSPHHDPTWVAWPGNGSVEYQIDNNFLRIRRWHDGQATVSEWERCAATAEMTIKHQLDVLRHRERMDQLPTLTKKSDGDDAHQQHHELLEWLLDSFFHPFGPPH